VFGDQEVPGGGNGQELGDSLHQSQDDVLNGRVDHGAGRYVSHIMIDPGNEGLKHLILVVGANPAWQKSVVCNRWEPGEVVRVQLASTAPAGKGFNTALALRTWNLEVELLSGAGPDSTDWGQACLAQGIGVEMFRLSGPIRTATTIRNLSTGEVTEMVEDGPSAEGSAEDRLVELARQKRSSARALVVAGTFPPGMSPRRLLQELSPSTVPVVVDSVPGVRALREMDGVPAALFVKLNESEWKSIFGESELVGALRAARRRWPRADLLATRGKEGAFLWEKEGDAHFLSGDPFPSDRVVHPIGAGDAFTAGIVNQLVAGAATLPACLYGMAVARASCFHPLPARFAQEDLSAELPRVHSEPTRV
jgi:fructose-1-phosphate kinase PfkB-like protein